MEEGSVVQTTVVMRMIEAAVAQEDDPGWSAKVLSTGLQITYTWFRRQTPTSTKDFYTVEAFVPWTTLAHAPKNPLLAVMGDLLQQKTEFKA